MGTLLRVGVLVAAVLVAAGGVALLLQRWDQVDRYGTFTGVAARLTSPASVIRAAVALDPAALAVLGLIVLVLTPVARVAFALLAFTKQRDRLYIAFSAIVLAVLFFGLSGRSL
jgi:uncharacterized membrane protein